MIKVDRIPDLAGGKHLIHGGQNHPGNGDNGAFFAPAFGDSLILDSIVWGFGGLNGGVSDLNQGGFKINARAGNAHRLLLSGGFVVAGRQTAPAAKLF